MRLSVKDIDEFYSALNANVVERKVFSVFYGALDENGVSWCSDTKNSDRFVDRINAFNNSLLLQVPLDRIQYKAKSTAYQKDPKINLTRIPTLIYWPNPESPMVLLEESCPSPEKIDIQIDRIFQSNGVKQ